MNRKTTAPSRPSPRPATPDGEQQIIESPDPMASITPAQRDDRLPVRASLRISPLLGAMPPDIVETFHYLVARLQLSEGGMDSPLAVVAANHGEGVTTVTRALGVVL